MKLDPRAIPAPLLIACALVFPACTAPPRADDDAARAIADAAGLPAPVAFRAVGPDGAPLDEPGGATDALTLSGAVQRAVSTDPRLHSALARVHVALADADQARLLPNPVLNVIFRWGPGSTQIEASLAQDLVAALQIPRRASAADNRLRQTAAEAVAIALDVIAEVRQRYAEAQSAAALIPLLEERQRWTTRVADSARARLEAGEGTRADADWAHAQLVELGIEIHQARARERDARLRLARLIGEPSSAAAWTLDTWQPPLAIDQPESAWIEAALRARPEIQAAVWRLRALGDDEALARLFPWEGAGLGVEAERDGGDWFVGPSISTPVPVFDTGQARRARVTAEQQEARHDLTLARRAVVEEVRVALLAHRAGAESLARARDELIPILRRRVALAGDLLQAGETDLTTLQLAELDLRVALARAVETERAASLAQVGLLRAVGGAAAAASVSPAQPAPEAAPEKPNP